VLGDQRLPLFRAEDNMDQIQTQGLRHGSLDVSGLQPSTLFTPPLPRPTAWAVMSPGLRPSISDLNPGPKEIENA
jgi:hypothetical protein